MSGLKRLMPSEPIQQSRPVRLLLGVTSSLSVVFFGQLLARLRREGFQVGVVSAPGHELDSIPVREGADAFAVPMEREISPAGDIKSLLQLLRLFRQKRPDLIDFGTPKAGLLGMIAGALARVPCRIYTIRGFRLETARGWKRWLLLTTERIACLCAHRVICVSPSLLRVALKHKLVDSRKATFIANGTCNGIEVERFAPTPDNIARAEAVRAQLNLPAGVPVIGFVGRFTRDKGIPELMKAFSELQREFFDLRLLLVGSYEDGDPVPQTIREHIDSDPNVLRPGFVADTSPYYHLMDLLVLPTHREGFPGVSLEAQSAGKPVVTTNATGAIGSVQDGKTGLIVPVGDSKALAEAIRSLLNDKPRRESMGRAGQAWVATDFNSDRVRTALVATYRRVIEQRLGNRKGTTPQCGMPLALKRILDIGGAAVGLSIMSPVLAITALLIRLTTGTPVVFRQQRPGKHGRPFTLYKFRTMSDARDSEGRLLPDADRLTVAGRFLRATSLDEFPQFWNVLRGDMSFVGPRPLLMEYLARYTPEQARRQEVIPGITGWAQVNGRNALSWEEKFALDVWYVDHWRFWLDIQILLRTSWAVLTRQGISNRNHATMPEFEGREEAGSMDGIDSALSPEGDKQEALELAGEIRTSTRGSEVNGGSGAAISHKDCSIGR